MISTFFQLQSKSLGVTVWDFYANSSPRFLGEVLLDLDTALLNNQTYWYDLEDHDENNGPLPHPGTRKIQRLECILNSTNHHVGCRKCMSTIDGK